MGFLDVGPLELLVIIAVSLIVFGPDRLPEVIGKVGRFVGQFRRMADEVTREFTRELNVEEASRSTYNYTPPPPPPVYSEPPSYAGLTSPPTTYQPVSDNPDSPVNDNENRILDLTKSSPEVGFAETPYLNGSHTPEPPAAETEDDWFAEQDGPVPFQPSAVPSAGFETVDSYQVHGEAAADTLPTDEQTDVTAEDQVATPVVTPADGVRH